MTSTLLLLLTASALTPQLVLTDDPAEPQRWRPIHDTVMGGLSQGGIFHEDGRLVFSGRLSLANNGGFASVRTLPRPFELDREQGLILRVRGDGRTYQLRIRDDDRFDGAAWRFEFDTTPGQWTLVTAPFASFDRTFRGRLLNPGDGLEPTGIRQLGLMIADKQAGPFRLEIDSVTAY